MAVIGSRDFTIGSATNVVYRDQHNQTINLQFGRVEEQRRVKRKEDGLELIDQYREIRLGDIHKVERTGSDEIWNHVPDEDERLVYKCTGKRTWYRARLHGDDKAYTGITYSGRDASKLWKEDFAKYSGSHDLDDSAMIWQLLGVNRSKVATLIFYEEWLPMAHLLNEANLFTVMYGGLLAETLECHPENLWLNSQSSQFSCGPQGPSYIGVGRRDQDIVKDLCSTADMLQADTCVRYLSKLSLNLDEHFLDVAAFSWYCQRRGLLCLNHVFDIQHHCTPICLSWKQHFAWDQSNGVWQRDVFSSHMIIHNNLLDFVDNLHFGTIYSGRQHHEIVRIAPGFVPENIDYDCFSLHDPKLVRGMTRLLLSPRPRWPEITTITSSYSRGWLIGDMGQTWLSRAHHHFGCDANGIENCYYMEFYAQIRIHHPPPTSSLGSKHDQHVNDGQDDLTIYLFIRPLTRLSEVEDWLSGEPFFWSFDESGTTQIAESTREQLGLPTLTPCNLATVTFRAWPKSTYDAVYKWQVARGFDPSTLDFAHSLGIPLFDSDTPEQSRSEEVVKVIEPEKPTESESPTTSDFDESFLSRLTKLSWWRATPDIPAFG